MKLLTLGLSVCLDYLHVTTSDYITVASRGMLFYFGKLY